MKTSQQHDFHVVIEKRDDGCYVASVVELLGCYTQAKTLKELNMRIKEVIKLYLEGKEKELEIGKFIAFKKVRI